VTVGIRVRAPAAVTSTPAFVVAALAGGVVIGGAVELATFSPFVGLGVLAALTIVLVSVRRLELGLFFLVAFTYAHAFEVMNEHAGVPSLRIPLVLLLLAVAFFVHEPDEALLGRSGEVAIAAFGAYGALLLASSVWAEDSHAALRAATAYGKDMLVVVAVLVLVRSRRALALAIWALVGTALVLGGLTLVQRLLHLDQTFLGFAKAPVQELSGTKEVTRAVGPIGSPNAYAQMLVVVIPLALGRFLHERHLALRLLALVASIVSIIAVALTFSRGGFLGLAAVVVVSFLVLFRLRPALLILGAAVLSLALLLPIAFSSSYTSRLRTITEALPGQSTNSADPSIKARAAFRHISLEMWLDHPFVGAGFANFPVRYNEYNRRVGTDPALGNSPHSLVPEVAAETGILGLALWTLLLLAALRSLLRVRRWAAAEAQRDVRTLVDALLISLIGFQVTSLFLAGAYPMLYWLLLAICFSVPQAVSAGVEPVRPPTLKRA
jgi:O-antigen ligase